MNFRRSLWRSEHSWSNVTEVFSAIFLILSLCICSNSMAQSAETALAPGIKVLAGEFEGHFYTPPDDRILEKLHSPNQNLIGGPPCATINVTYTGFTPEAQTAFQAAVDIWETVIESSVTIEIDATWEALGPGILGSASSYLHRNFTNAPNSNYFPASLANEIAGTDINPSNPEIVASFSSVYSNWYFGTDGATPAGEYDLMSVVLHEIGHGLGFSSSKDYDPDTGIGSFGHSDGSILYEYDEYLTNGIGGTPLVSYANGTFLGDILTGGNVYNSSALAAAGNGGSTPKMYAPATYAGGSSISHWDEATYPAGNPQSLMTPSIGQGEAIHNPGDMAIGLLEEMGWPICLTPIVENDNPCDAINIPCGETISGSTIDATNSETGSPTCANGSYIDLFYTFTAVPGYTYDISVNGDDYDGVLVLYSGTCNSLTELDCADNGLSAGIEENISYTPPVDGAEQTMTIRTYDWAISGGSFDLTVTCLPPNDNPCDATALTCNNSVTGNTTGATDSGLGNFGCTGGTIADLFYFIQVDANYTYTFTVQGDNYDGILALYSGTCGDLTEIACVDDGLSAGIAETIVYESTTSQILFVRTSDWFASAGEFLLTVDCAASNQDPCDALEIGCGQILSGSTDGGTQSSVASPSCANGSLIDTYYQFEAFPGGTYQVLVNGDGYDGVLVAYTGLCEGELTQIACADNGTQNGIEEEINIAVDEATTILVRTYDWSGTSDFEISLNCFPDNDLPCDALPIACGETINGGNTGATDSPLGNPSCASANSSDVFYSFEADPSLVYTATVNGANYDGVLVAYSGPCDGELIEIACADNGLSAGIEETITFQLETAGPVLLRTMDWGASGGEFEISLSCSPENDNACDALPISCGESLHGGTYFANVSIPVLDPTCTGGSKQDVFYEFMALPGFEYEVTVDGDSDYDAVLAAYSGDCSGTLTELACSDEDLTNGGDEVITLTVESETQIIIQTYDYFPSQGTFQIYLECTELPDCPDLGLDFGDTCDDGNPATYNDEVLPDCSCAGIPYDCPELLANIGEICDDGNPETNDDLITPECECEGTYPPPPNDTCDNAETLSVMQPGECSGNGTFGTTLGANNEAGAYSCDDTGEWRDVFYSFNSGDFTIITVFIELITQGDIVIEVSEACGGTPIYCQVETSINTFNVDPNTNYIIRTGPNLDYGDPGDFTICVEGEYECPFLGANVGDSCDDGNPGTIDDVVTLDCTCEGEPTTATIIGTYEWNSDCGPRDMTIAFYEPGTANLVDIISTSLAANGTFSVSNVPVGLFDVYIKISGILQKGYFGATIIDGANPFFDNIPPRGDFNDDNGINISDFSIFNAAFGSSAGDPNYNFLTDMNCDGGVNVVDFSIFNSNFGASGQEP